MSKIGGGKYRRGKNSVEEKMVSQLDKLSEFEEFEKEILPALKADVRKRTPAKQVLEKIMTIAAARLASLAATEKDPVKALALIKEVFDRVEGKSKDRVEQEHKFKNLKDEQLDALLLSKLAAQNRSDDDKAN